MAACTLYNVCFFVYVWLVPVFLQYLMRAPKDGGTAPFYPVPRRTLSGDVPQLYMSSFPQTTAEGVNHCRPCKEMYGKRSGMYQWDIMLSMSYRDLIKESKDKPVSTMYPLVFASNDAVTWKVVADADDVAGERHWQEKSKREAEATHLSAPLLVANLKNFGCVDDETVLTDPFLHHFASTGKAKSYKWRLVKHVAMHGSVNLVACVMQGMDDMNQLIHTYARDCLYQGEMKCHLTPKQALQKCFAIGSACGQACGFFSPNSAECRDGMLDPQLFAGLTERRVKIKTSPGGGGAAEALVYCSKKPCKSGLHFNNMYVEAENPIEFMEAQMDERNKEKGSYYMLMFAMSDFHPPMHTFSVAVKSEKDEKEKEEAHHTLLHHALKHADRDEAEEEEEEEEDEEDEEDEEEDDDEDGEGDKHKKDHKASKHDKKDKDKDKGDGKKHKKPHKPQKHERTCVDLPGVRLAEVDKSGIASFVKKDKTDDPLSCTEECGKRLSCAQSIFSQANKGCYLFKIPTVEVHNYSTLFNSSYCGDSKDKHLMMTMLHQAYKNYVPPAPKPAPGPAAPAAPIRVLSEALNEQKYYWQIAHVPNLTMGVLRDQGANEVRVIPRNTSCFSTPGFIYMVACMTAKPVYVSDRTHALKPPPFNDRCLAVGGLCGATCGSGQKVDDNVAKYCPTDAGLMERRLREAGTSPYASVPIPKTLLVQPIDPRGSAQTVSVAARWFFNIFVFIVILSYVTTIMSKFPGLFTDKYPIHTWDEVKTHGYVLDKFGSAVTCTTSATESKLIVLRNWIGKVTTRPRFEDSVVPTFAKWVDVFCDEGHREGARQLWSAWTDFLDTSPPLDFMQEWSANLRSISPDLPAERTPFDLKWKENKGKRVLPVMPGQASGFTGPGEDAPDGGVQLQPDSLARLRDLCDVYKALPADLVLGTGLGLPRSDDCILTRAVKMGFLEGAHKASGCFTLQYSKDWQKQLDKQVGERVQKAGSPMTKEKYEKMLMATDKNGKKLNVFGGTPSIDEKRFPLHLREPPARKDRQVIMVYCARAKPEIERKGIVKTRAMDKYLWACLRPKAVRTGSGGDGPRRSFTKRKGAEAEATPLLNNGAAEDQSERSWSSVAGDKEFVLEAVKKSVEGVVERQHQRFIEGAFDEENEKSPLQADLTKAYLKYRTVDSDWEMARFCYGEVVGEERDVDGNEVVILDNPSPALLELVSDLGTSSQSSGRPGMGLVALETVPGESGCFGQKVNRTAHVTKPSLEFRFANSQSGVPSDFQKEFRRQLQQMVNDATQDVNALQIQEKKKGNDLFVEVTGPGKLIELIRARDIRHVKVKNLHGRMIDTHPSVVVRKDLLMPYAGVRGRSGGLNFIVDLLQFRDGFIGTAAEGDATPERMLLGVFEASHQPHPDFWRRCLPKFMNNTDQGYTYKVNGDIALVQAPEGSPAGASDALSGIPFNIMNIIRNRCGGVTSCGTNAVWQVDAKEFSRQEDEAVLVEFFDSRTIIDDTATTHVRFCAGKRSVYVQEKVSTGIAKVNSECLCEMQMRAEGAVQLFWVELFGDRLRQLLLFTLGVFLFVGMIMLLSFGSWSSDLTGYNLFCDSEGTPTLFLGNSHSFCNGLLKVFSFVLTRNAEKVTFEMAEKQYMRLIDVGITWLLICVAMALVTFVLSWRRIMPSIIRVFIMMENIANWLTSCNIIYWLCMVLFMTVGMSPPLTFNGPHFMFFVLLLNLSEYFMLAEYKSMTDCTEVSILRSQAMHIVATPLYLAAMWMGTTSAWGILWQRADKSFWAAEVPEVVRLVTVWVTIIWVAFLGCIFYALLLVILRAVLGETADPSQQDVQLGGCLLIGVIAVTVWEPLLILWGFDKTLDRLSTSDKKPHLKFLANLMVMWRSKAWILRYVLNFVLPIIVLLGIVPSSSAVIALAAYSITAHDVRV